MIHQFQFHELEMKGAFLIEPFCAEDERGALIKDYNVDTFRSAGISHDLKEVFYTVSRRGTIRAIHFQLGKQQPKLVRCISGHVYDVLVDLRPNSDTFGTWRGFHLTGENRLSLLIPAWFGHGYLVVDDSIVSYQCAEVFSAEGDSGILFSDKEIGIAWPFDLIGGEKNLIISEKDKKLGSLQMYLHQISGGQL